MGSLGISDLNIVGADVVEVAPDYDTNAEITSIAAADAIIDSKFRCWMSSALIARPTTLIVVMLSVFHPVPKSSLLWLRRAHLAVSRSITKVSFGMSCDGRRTRRLR